MSKYIEISAAICIAFALIGLIKCINVQNLFDQMSSEEKCGQMTLVDVGLILSDNRPPNPTEFNDSFVDVAKLLDALNNKHLGAIFNTPYGAPNGRSMQRYMKLIHTFALNSTRLKIPLLQGIDHIHGADLMNESVLFPPQMAQASSFNVMVARRIGEITAKETSAVGVRWNYSPVLDIGRQPLWPRLWETYGEDVYMASKMGEAYISGHQGQDLKNRTKAAVCLKHYMGYSYPFNGLDRTNAYIPDVLLREKFLPTFAQGVATGALSVMVNSANVNGIPGHMNSYYLNDILKGELQFQGFAVSDWQDIIRLHTRDMVAETPEDAVRIAVMAGLDMSMVPNDYSFYDLCVNLTKKDLAFSKRVDDATMRILRFKEAIGLFDDPFPHEEDLKNIATQESIDFNLEAARETIILAKNTNNFLPITKDKKLLVTGPTANIISPLTGAWTYTWQGNEENIISLYGRKKHTVYESLKLHATSDVTYVQGSNLTDLTNVEEAVAAAANVDVIVLCVGEESYAETPGNIVNLAINEAQTQLAQALSKTGKPIVVVYLGGRPRLINEIEKAANSLLIAFYPGERGGEAIAEVIFGDANPSARLPITYPAHPSGYTTYDRLPIEESQNYYVSLYPFGHGLSYTTFTYSNLVLSTTSLVVPNDLTVSVTVTNSGNRDGKEAVLMYINDEYASFAQPARKLRKFTKIELKSGESKTVSFCLNLDDLSFINAKSRRVYEPGQFNIYIANLSASFELIV